MTQNRGHFTDHLFYKNPLKPILYDITQNDSTIQHNFAFVDEILTQVTNIPLDETTDICIKRTVSEF